MYVLPEHSGNATESMRRNWVRPARTRRAPVDARRCSGRCNAGLLNGPGDDSIGTLRASARGTVRSPKTGLYLFYRGGQTIPGQRVGRAAKSGCATGYKPRGSTRSS